MSADKLTGWFDGNVKPSRVGIYEREYITDHAYSMWDGKRWCAGCFEIDFAARRKAPSWQQCLPWRGLAADPKKGRA